MKKINLDLYNVALRVYDVDEKEKFESNTGCSVPSENYGLCAGPNIWIGRTNGVSVEQIVLHELIHFVDWCIEHSLEAKFSSLWDSTEMRAYGVQYLFGKVMDYVKEAI